VSSPAPSREPTRDCAIDLGAHLRAAGSAGCGFEVDDDVDATQRGERCRATKLLARPSLQAVAHHGAADLARRGQAEARMIQSIVDEMHRQELAAATPSGAIGALVVGRAPEPLVRRKALPSGGPGGHGIRR